MSNLSLASSTFLSKVDLDLLFNNHLLGVRLRLQLLKIIETQNKMHSL